MTSMHFQFYFAGVARVELIETCFRSTPLDIPRVTVRGKTSGAARHAGSFQWTSAVRALCVLFIRAAISKVDSAEVPLLTGAHGSPAASLDYAISKQPGWLVDMFGSDSFGRCVAQRLLDRTNPERKRPGPVAIGIKPMVVSESRIDVFLDGKPVSSAEALKELLSGLSLSDQMLGQSAPREEQSLAA